MPKQQSPSPAKNPLAFILRGKTHTILGFLVLGFVLGKILLLIFFPQTPLRASDLTVENILQAVNQQRTLRNFGALNSDNRLSIAAQSKTDDMQSRHYFAHVDPDGNYIWPKIVAAGYTPYLQLGENLAIEFYDTDSLIAAWMNSPTHRANLLNDGFRDQGMGLTFGNSDAGQYHSAVANTFGAMIAKKTAPQTPASSSVPAATTTTPPPSPKPTPKPAPSPAPAPVAPTVATSTSIAPTPIKTTTPIPGPRSGDFVLTNAIHAPESASSTAPSLALAGSKPSGTTAPALVNQTASALSGFQLNRYFSLAFGLVLFLFLITDLQGSDPDNIKIKGKKINNLVLLFLALVVIGVMYWL